MMLWGKTDRLRSKDTDSIVVITIDELVKYYKYNSEKVMMLVMMVMMMVVIKVQ